MNSLKETINKIANQFDSPETNLNEFLSQEQRQGKLRILADLSDKKIRKQTIEN